MLNLGGLGRKSQERVILAPLAPRLPLLQARPAARGAHDSKLTVAALVIDARSYARMRTARLRRRLGNLRAPVASRGRRARRGIVQA
jgi:hypothetical protein